VYAYIYRYTYLHRDCAELTATHWHVFTTRADELLYVHGFRRGDGAERRTAVYENFENIILFSKLRLDTDLTRPKRETHDLIAIQYIGI